MSAAHDVASTASAVARGDARPVLFVTNHAPQFRVPAFQALHERENVVFALIGGHVRHGGGVFLAETPQGILRERNRASATVLRRW